MHLVPPRLPVSTPSPYGVFSPKAGGSPVQPRVVSAQMPMQLTPQFQAPQRILLLRHGESEANARQVELPDPVLTSLGAQQARSWQHLIGRFGAEVALVSPLKRAVQTACLALAQERTPLHLSAAARELWWDSADNQPGSATSLRALLRTLPRGSDVCGVDDAFAALADDLCEDDSPALLLAELASRRERTVLVVCHWGVINELCGKSAENGELIECTWAEDGGLAVVARHPGPIRPKEKSGPLGFFDILGKRDFNWLTCACETPLVTA